MSVVVYRDGIMASDSQVSVADTYHYGIEKTFMGKAGELVGACGTLKDMHKFMNWYRQRDHVLDDDIDFEAIVVRSTGEVFGYFDDDTPIPLVGNYFAIGTGADIALGALYFGATAEQAVFASCAHSTTCSTPVKTIRLYDQPVT